MNIAPKISVITTCKNAAEDLRVTAQSIREQTYRDVEWIVIDGESTDETIELVRGLDDVVSRFVSEYDEGVYFALNKGLSIATGEWIIFMGAGDTFYSGDSIMEFVSRIPYIPETVNIAYGGVLLVMSQDDAAGRLVYPKWAGLDGPWSAGRPQVPCHQGIFHRADLFMNGIRFNTSYKIVADGEIILRELLRNGGFDLDMVISKMLLGGISTKPANRFLVIRELLSINRKMGLFWKRPFYQCAVYLVTLVRHTKIKIFRG
jgi:glycosyltransferase involved in cell wall biosynthesis